MRVAVVHGLLRGGAARRMAGTVTELSAQPDVELRVFTLTGCSPTGARTVETAWRPAAPERPRPLRPAWRYVDLVALRRTWSTLWDVVNGWQPDAVFANPCADPGGAPPLLHRLTAPVVYYCDEPRRVDYEVAAARASNPATRIPYAAMRRVQRHDERRSVAAADTLLTNSFFTAARIAAAYGRSAQVVTPGIAPVFDQTGATPSAFDRRTHVLSVGTLIPSKGHDLVVEAVALSGLALPVVVVAPRVDPQETGRLERLARHHGVDLDIRVGIGDEELLTLYRSALATAYLAVEEPLGLASLESQACGTPVVVADDGGLVETLDAGVTGLVVPRSASAAAKALRTLADPTRYADRAAAAQARPVPRDAGVAAAVRTALDAAVERWGPVLTPGAASAGDS